MSSKRFEEMLTGGHPNSLGRTEEVVELVLNDKQRLADLYECYSSDDEVVRLRVSSAFKRIFRVKNDWFVDYIDKFQTLVPELKQPSAQWTLAQLHLELENLLSPKQRQIALDITKEQLEHSTDWIVISFSINLLEHWAKSDETLRAWLIEKVKFHANDKRKTVSKKANAALKSLLGI